MGRVEESPLGEGAARLAFRRVGARTVVSRSASRSPVRLLTPRNHGQAAWVYLASFGGGLLANDHVRLDVDVEPSAFGLVGTQASTKVYRAPPGARGARQTLRAEVGEAASLVVIPDPVVCFADARYCQVTDIALRAGASLFLGDVFTSGRSACGERWAFARYESRARVTLEGAPLHTDALRLDAGEGRSLAARMGRFDVIASVLLVGPRFAAVRAAARALVPEPRGGDALLAVCPREGRDDVLLLRIAAPRFDRVQAMLRPCFDALASVLGDDPFARKW